MLRLVVPTTNDRPVVQFSLGTARRPDGSSLAVDPNSLLLNGRPWPVVMGEFHYSRCPADQWRRELLKMKAGGIDIIATYVFWIHHEEIEDRFDWSGCRDLRKFIQMVQEVGMYALVRCGPWCHGEVRNGGFPDWLLDKGWRLRTNDPNYLAKVRTLYSQIAEQLRGLLWKDGGPVIGIQLENEYAGPAEHLLTLRRLARDVGLDVPFYTRTGWPNLSSPIPFGQILPLYGAYAEGFWDRQTTPMPGRYWAGFHFSRLRNDTNIANELLGRPAAIDQPDDTLYPYLTCEVGGGMMSSYHRRVLIRPADIESIALVKLGSGSSLLGYYMYHGGVNPDGKATTLMESQATRYTNYNDMPVKNYDFQAPLGQYGQIRPHYHLLRRLHLFIHDFGSDLVRMPTYLPDTRPNGPHDVDTLRWSVRSDGKAGFIFVNNYERLRSMPAKDAIQFEILLPSGRLAIPDRPITIPQDHCLIWPFNLDLAGGIRLAWATARPLCRLDNGQDHVIFFAATDGIPAYFCLPSGLHIETSSGSLDAISDTQIVRDPRPGRVPAIQIDNGPSNIQIVLLDRTDSLRLWKARWAGRDRVFLTNAGLVVDGNELELTIEPGQAPWVCIYPCPAGVLRGNHSLDGRDDGIFKVFWLDQEARPDIRPSLTLIRPAHGNRRITIGSRQVASAPNDLEMEKAALWRIILPEGMDLGSDPILQVRYVGDLAKVWLDGRLIIDDFYNGNPLEIGLAHYLKHGQDARLEIAVLPLARDVPIYLPQQVIAEMEAADGIARIEDVRLIHRNRVLLTATGI